MQHTDTLDSYTTHVLDDARAQIAFAYEHQPLWRKKMSEAGLRPHEVQDASDIRRLPTTRKVDYRRNFPEGVLASGRTMMDPLVFRSQSSGTAGDRCVTVTDKCDLAARMSSTLSVHSGMMDRLSNLNNPRCVRYAAPNCSDVECAAPFTTMRDRILADGTLVLPVAHDLLSTPPRMIADAIAELMRYAPDWIYADATHLAFLVRNCRTRQLAPPSTCACIALTFTQATCTARRQLGAFFAPVVECAEVLSMSEFGWLGMECPRGTMHLNAAAFYPELLVDDRAARSGEVAELVLTSLADRLSPHVRYRTGDCYRLLPPCPCGHPFPAVRSEGRLRDMVLIAGRIALTPKDVDLLIDQPWLDVYKLEQVAPDQLELRFVPNDLYAWGCDEEVQETLRELVPGDLRLVVEAVPSIPCERSGKFISCVSRVAAAQLPDLRPTTS